MDNVLEWLEQDAKSVPEKCAFADADASVSFGDLHLAAQRAGTWVAQRSPACRAVALYLEKSTVAITGMFGAVYARCCYCVVDVRQPLERACAVLESLRPALVLTDKKNHERAQELLAALAQADERFAQLELALVEDVQLADADRALLARRRAEALSTDPLYVNFTSGSTGTPKGVAVGHASVIDFIPKFTGLFGFSGRDAIANQAPFDFDVSVKDIYSGLACAATVHMVPREYFSEPAKLMDFLADRKVTACTWAVSAMCFVSIMGGFEYRVPDTIRKVIFSGEVMPPKQLAKWRKFLPDATFANVYGPTEVTCNCSYYLVEREFAKDEVIPMGKPFANEKVFLLDEQDRLVEEEGVTGEICVGGAGLALGYWNDPAKTAEVFVQNPLNSTYREMVYRTGDLACYNAQGDLVYLSRKDHQIKHMGQRIELGEIDAAAQGVDGVTRACCLYNAKKKRLLLFYTGELEKSELLEALREKLPQYMVPNKIYPLEEMPLNKNGKIDRNALAGTC